jgi:hypothetical protein
LSYLLNQQDGAATSASSSTASSADASQNQAGGAASSSGGGSSSSSTTTMTETKPDGEEIELTEDASGKIISEKVIKAAHPADASAKQGAQKDTSDAVQNS